MFEVDTGSRPGGRRLVLERFKSPRIAAALLLTVVASACSDLATSPRAVPAAGTQAAVQPLGPSFAAAGADKEKQKDGYGCTTGVATPAGPHAYRTWSSAVKFPTAALAPNGAWRQWMYGEYTPDGAFARVAICRIPGTERALKVVNRLYNVPADARVQNIGNAKGGGEVGIQGQCGLAGEPDCALDGIAVTAPLQEDEPDLVTCTLDGCVGGNSGTGWGDPGGTDGDPQDEEGILCAIAAAAVVAAAVYAGIKDSEYDEAYALWAAKKAAYDAYRAQADADYVRTEEENRVLFALGDEMRALEQRKNAAKEAADSARNAAALAAAAAGFVCALIVA